MILEAARCRGALERVRDAIKRGALYIADLQMPANGRCSARPNHEHRWRRLGAGSPDVKGIKDCRLSNRSDHSAGSKVRMVPALYRADSRIQFARVGQSRYPFGLSLKRDGPFSTHI